MTASTRRPRHRRRGVFLLVLMLWTTACFDYRPVGALRPSQQLPPDLRVTTFDGRVELLATSAMVRDTIRGYRAHSTDLIEIPLAYVDLLEVKRFRLIDSVLAGTITILLFIYVVDGLGRKPLPGN